MFQEIAVTPRGYQTPGRFSKTFQYLSEILTEIESIFNRCSVAHVGSIDEKTGGQSSRFILSTESQPVIYL